MKRLLVFIGLATVSAILLYACNGASTTVNEGKTTIEKENIALVEKYIEAVQKKDVNTMAEMLSDDYMGYGPAYGDSIDKAGAVQNFRNVADNLYDKIVYTRSINLAAKITDGPRPGDFVSNWAHLTITYKDGRGPVNLYTNTGYRIENGKITMTRTIYDEADAIRQLESTGSAKQ